MANWFYYNKNWFFLLSSVFLFGGVISFSTNTFAEELAVVKLEPNETHEFADSFRFSVLSPDGKKIVASYGKTAVIFDAQTGKELHQLQGHRNDITDIHFSFNGKLDKFFSSNGKRIVTISGDHTARIWHTETGTLSHILEGHTHVVKSANASSIGKFVLPLGEDNTIRTWYVRIGQDRFAFFSPGEKRLITNGYQNILIRDVRTREVSRLGTLIMRFNRTIFSPDGKFLLAYDYNGKDTVYVWDITQKNKDGDCPFYELKGDLKNISSADFSPDSKLIVTTSCDDTAGEVRAWKVTTPPIWGATSPQRLALKKFSEAVHFAHFSSDSKKIIAGGDKTPVTIWNWNDDSADEPYQLPDNGSNAVFFPDGNRVLIKDKIWILQVKDIDGKDFSFKKLKGKKVLVVNVASKCSLTPQYKELQEIYTKYGGEKFVIVAFPTNIP